MATRLRGACERGQAAPERNPSPALLERLDGRLDALAEPLEDDDERLEGGGGRTLARSGGPRGGYPGALSKKSRNYANPRPRSPSNRWVRWVRWVILPRPRARSVGKITTSIAR
jgi:hypothetical protein